MSEASFESEKNASQDNESDPKEQGTQNTADSQSQSDTSENSLDETHMTEIDINENKEAGNHSHTVNDDADEDDCEDQAKTKTSEVLKDVKENADVRSTSSVASVVTQADVKVKVMICIFRNF